MAAGFTGKDRSGRRDSRNRTGGRFMPPTAPRRPERALRRLDDVGITTWDCFGGLVGDARHEPHRRAWDQTDRSSTPPRCSPTRAALLTGRNPTSVGMATVWGGKFTDGFPNCSGRIPDDAALLSEVLLERGYNTTAWASGT